MQNPNKEKPSPDQVVVLLDRTNSKPKEYPDKYANPGDPSTPPPPYSNEKPPPNLTSTATRPLPFPKPKSRFVPSTYPHPCKLSDSDEPNAAAGEKLYSSDDDGEDENDLFEDDDEEKQKKKYERKKQKVGWWTITEWATFVVILACLITSLTKQPWNRQRLWGLMIWKWVLMVMVVFSGKLVSCWLVGLLAFLIEQCFMLREKVVYFVYGLRKSVRNCIWLGLVLLSWYVMFNPEVEDSTNTHKFRKRVWRILMTGTIGAVIWLVKIILVKVLASSFHVHTFFDRMKLSVFHYVILEKLSGTQPQPLDEVNRSPDQSEWKKRTGRAKCMPSRMSRRIESGSRRIDMEKLRRLSRTNASAYTVKRLVSHVMYSGLSSMSRTVDKTMEDFKASGSDMTSEMEARLCAKRIFNNVAKDGEKYIEEDDLLRFLEKDEVKTILALSGALESRKIKKSALRNWVVEAYRERQALAWSLNDTKTAVEQLHKLAGAVVIIIIIIMSLLVMGVATSKVLLVVSSNLVLVAFTFGNTCKTICEAIIFVFVMHPFDVGDRCVIDSIQMVVEEMNILTTVFIRYDNEKICYPNSVLLTKPISNFNRSPQMGDEVLFAIDAATKVDTFMEMKDAMKKYIDSKSKNWHPKHYVIVKEFKDVNKMEIALYLTHTINFQDYIEKLNRRSELILELKRIFESLQIRYHLLPQKVHLVNETGRPLQP